jgi:hypothetical protein
MLVYHMLLWPLMTSLLMFYMILNDSFLDTIYYYIILSYMFDHYHSLDQFTSYWIVWSFTILDSNARLYHALYWYVIFYPLFLVLSLYMIFLCCTSLFQVLRYHIIIMLYVMLWFVLHYILYCKGDALLLILH